MSVGLFRKEAEFTSLILINLVYHCHLINESSIIAVLVNVSSIIAVVLIEWYISIIRVTFKDTLVNLWDIAKVDNIELEVLVKIVDTLFFDA